MFNFKIKDETKIPKIDILKDINDHECILEKLNLCCHLTNSKIIAIWVLSIESSDSAKTCQITELFRRAKKVLNGVIK